MDQISQLSQSSLPSIPVVPSLTQEPIAINPSSPKPQELNQVYAGFGRRLLAFLLDIFFFRIFVATLELYVGLVIYFLFHNPVDIAANLAKAISNYGYFFEYVFFVMYSSIFLSLFSTTPGKYLCKLRVLGENNLHISKSSSVFRSLLQPFSTLLFGIGYVSMFRSPKRQAWHDKVAKTIVIRISESKHYIRTILLSIAIFVGLFIFAALAVSF